MSKSLLCKKTAKLYKMKTDILLKNLANIFKNHTDQIANTKGNISKITIKEKLTIYTRKLKTLLKKTQLINKLDKHLLLSLYLD